VQLKLVAAAAAGGGAGAFKVACVTRIIVRQGKREVSRGNVGGQVPRRGVRGVRPMRLRPEVLQPQLDSDPTKCKCVDYITIVRDFLWGKKKRRERQTDRQKEGSVATCQTSQPQVMAHRNTHHLAEVEGYAMRAAPITDCCSHIAVRHDRSVRHHAAWTFTWCFAPPTNMPCHRVLACRCCVCRSQYHDAKDARGHT
jgi:hypothetical protein